VVIDDPAGGLASVRLVVEDEALRNRRQLALIFMDVRGSARMVRSFEAQVDGKPVEPVSNSAPATVRGESGVTADEVLVYVVPIPRGARSLTIAYTIDPTYFPPGANLRDLADARSRISPELAVVRSTSLFPRIDTASGDARLGVEFELPRGWVAVTPWRSEDGRVVVPVSIAASVEYIAIGPFETRVVSAGAAEVRVATPALVATGDLPIEAIIAREMELLAAPFKRPGPFLATVVPDDFMHGGAAGDHSIVQSSAPVVLAHEVFHWWNDASLTALDASWFREGLTEYYGIRVAREAGAWTADAETACLADLDAEMRRIELTGPRSLKEASLDPAALRLVYAKGALFWLLVDQRLRASGRYLEEGVRRVVTSPREGLTTAELRTLFSSLYAGAVDEEFDRYVLGANRLPDLGLPTATGRSGCARQ
jgi:predicted metalloprotease with PDZ domain